MADDFNKPLLRPTTVPADLMKVSEHKELSAEFMGARNDAFATNRGIEEFLDQIPEREDGYPTLIMFGAKTGVKRERTKQSVFAQWLEIIWPLFFWFDMMKNLGCIIKELWKDFVRHPFNQMHSSGLALLALGYPFAYGWYVVAQSTQFNADLFSKDENEWYQTCVFFARAFGKAATLCHLVGVLFITRTMATMWDTIPHNKRPVGWRKLHIWLCQSLFLLGCLHGAAHIVRVFYVNNTDGLNIILSQGWENWSLFTGVTLAGIILIMNVPYAFLRSKYWTRKHGIAFKSFFRHSHRTCFIIFEIIYLLHSSSFSPVVLLLFWFYSLKSYDLAVERFGFRFLYKSKAHNNAFVSNKVIPKSASAYVLELRVCFHEEIPMKYGYYCVVKFGVVGAAYTMIPLDSRTALFRIQKCALTETIKEQLGRLSYTEVGSVYATPSSQFTKLECYGPYLSGDYNTGNSKKVAVLVSGTGNAVSDALALFNSARRQYWKSLTILNAGSKQLDDQYYSIQGIPCAAAPENIPVSGQEQLNHYASQPRKHHVNLINVNSLNVFIVRRLLLALQSQDFSVVICSALWRGLVDKVLEMDVKLAGDAGIGNDAGTINRQMIHIEDFEIA